MIVLPSGVLSKKNEGSFRTELRCQNSACRSNELKLDELVSNRFMRRYVCRKCGCGFFYDVTPNGHFGDDPIKRNSCWLIENFKNNIKDIKI